MKLNTNLTATLLVAATVLLALGGCPQTPTTEAEDTGVEDYDTPPDVDPATATVYYAGPDLSSEMNVSDTTGVALGGMWGINIDDGVPGDTVSVSLTLTGYIGDPDSTATPLPMSGDLDVGASCFLRDNSPYGAVTANSSLVDGRIGFDPIAVILDSLGSVSSVFVLMCEFSATDELARGEQTELSFRVVTAGAVVATAGDGTRVDVNLVEDNVFTWGDYSRTSYILINPRVTLEVTYLGSDADMYIGYCGRLAELTYTPRHGFVLIEGTQFALLLADVWGDPFSSVTLFVDGAISEILIDTRPRSDGDNYIFSNFIMIDEDESVTLVYEGCLRADGGVDGVMGRLKALLIHDRMVVVDDEWNEVDAPTGTWDPGWSNVWPASRSL